MSPRSAEFMAEARARVVGARAALAGGFDSLAVSAAYYAMLYAARAVLSEEDRYAKTHRGTWTLLRETLVCGGRLDSELVRGAEETQRLREAGDYDARAVAPEEAEAVLARAEQFVAAIERLLRE